MTLLMSEPKPPAPLPAALISAPAALDITALQRRDTAEFARLVDEHAAMVASVCQAIGLRDADADDATAEAFAAVFKALPTFESRARLSTWIYRVAFRQVLHVAQRRRTWHRRFCNSAAIESSADPRAAKPGAAIEADEQRERLWAVVHALEPRQAIAVSLFYRHGQDVASIAAALDCPANTVKTLLSRARQRLRLVLEKKGLMP